MVGSDVDLLVWVKSLIEENKRLQDEVKRLRLAAALRAYRPAKKRGRPKKQSIEGDISLLELVEETQIKWGNKSRLAVLRRVMEETPGRPASPEKKRRLIETLNKRLSEAKKVRDSSNN
jgi:hypothetical protein